MIVITGIKILGISDSDCDTGLMAQSSIGRSWRRYVSGTSARGWRDRDGLPSLPVSLESFKFDPPGSESVTVSESAE